MDSTRKIKKLDVMLYKKISIFILFPLFIFNCNSQIYKNDHNLMNTFLEALQNDNHEEIKSIVDKNPHIKDSSFKINNKNVKFSYLLMWAIKENRINTFKALLELGADPNFKTNSKRTPLLIASNYRPDGQYYDFDFAKLLLDYGANVNYSTQESDSDNITRVESPLLISCQTGNLKLVKLYIDAGADADKIFYSKKFGDHISQNSALKAALSFNRMDVAKYLLVEVKVDFDISFGRRADGTNLDINYFLRKNIFLIDTEEFNLKQDIVKFLEKNGVDYRNSSIPKHAVNFAKANYPDSWEEYLNVY